MHRPQISATLMGATTGYGMAWDSRDMSGVKVIIDAGDNLAFRADTILIPGGNWASSYYRTQTTSPTGLVSPPSAPAW